MIRKVNRHRSCENFTPENVVRNFWNSFNIMDAINFVQEPWDEVSSSTVTTIWKELLPIIPSRNDGTDVASGYPEVMREVVNLAREVEREGFEDVQETEVSQLILPEPTYTPEEIEELATEPPVEDHVLTVSCRYASKKSSGGGGLKNAGNAKAKHRGWKRQDGGWVSAGTSVATQNSTRWHPGLNVGFGRNGTLYALTHGKVVITCEKVDLNWNHGWNKKCYGGREGESFYKKHFNVIPEAEHNRFKLVDKI
ncbi:hypothetical protein QAD02_004597 [Eretmocerus hayati]|uniref:Uncharacterized protein n=1 Tax=Eretmocerus hayati TaxID=131215 RepID=A0ACC2NUU9_9HYME|nr:hypothetical protein QAD02_004597 [Eretmocerus hayati]